VYRARKERGDKLYEIEMGMFAGDVERLGQFIVTISHHEAGDRICDLM
jgi:hypothetical protein